MRAQLLLTFLAIATIGGSRRDFQSGLRTKVTAIERKDVTNGWP